MCWSTLLTFVHVAIILCVLKLTCHVFPSYWDCSVAFTHVQEYGDVQSDGELSSEEWYSTVFFGIPRAMFSPKIRDQKPGLRGWFANYEVGKDLFTSPRWSGAGVRASTLLLVNALSKLSLFFTRAKRSRQTAECECTLVGEVNVYVFYENEYEGHAFTIFHSWWKTKNSSRGWRNWKSRCWPKIRLSWKLYKRLEIEERDAAEK
jgi:hypothetical protein